MVYSSWMKAVLSVCGVIPATLIRMVILGPETPLINSEMFENGSDRPVYPGIVVIKGNSLRGDRGSES